MRIPTAPWGMSLAAALLLTSGSSHAAPPSTFSPESVTDATLSYLVDQPGECHWRQYSPFAKSETVAKMPTACSEVQLAWSPDGTRALIHFKTIGKDGEYTHHLRLVDLATSGHTNLPIPTQGDLVRHGFDFQGRPIALLEDPVDLFPEEAPEEGEAAHERKGYEPYLRVVTEGSGEDARQVIRFEEETYPASNVGTAGLAHAFRLEDGQWTRIETQSTYYGVESAPSVHALDAMAQLGPTPEAMVDEANASFTAVPDDAAVIDQLNRLSRLKQKGKEGKPAQTAPQNSLWQQYETPNGSLYVNQAGEKGFTYLAAPMYRDGPNGPVRLHLRSIDNDSALTIFTRGDLMLVVGDNGKGPASLLWSMKKAEVIASLPGGAEQVTFWPKPAPIPEETPDAEPQQVPAPVAAPTPQPQPQPHSISAAAPASVVAPRAYP